MKGCSVFLYGYWEHNLGDDLFLYLFMKRYPNTHVYLLTKSKYKTLYSYGRITPIVNDTFLFHIKNKLCKVFTSKGFIFQRIVPEADCAVILGGSLFMEGGNWRGYMASTYSNMRKFSKRCYVLGCNFGPFESEEFLEFFSDLLLEMDGVCLRDRYSVNLIGSSLRTRKGISTKEFESKIRYVPDIAFQLLNTKMILPSSPYSDCYVISIIQPERRIGLHGYGEIYKRAILSLALRLTEEDEEKPVIFYAASAALGDGDMAVELCRNMEESGRRAVSYEYKELDESLALLKEAKGIIATHFHTMLLGILYEVPTYPVIYNLKMETVIKDYGFLGKSIKVKELTENKAEWLEEVIEALGCKPVISKDMIERSELFFQYTDKILH